jgi:hypothetical protein
LTLVDLKNRMEPGDGEIAGIAETLAEENEVLTDIPWARGNLVTGDVHFRRSVMPTAQKRKINEGIEATASKSVATTDTCVGFAARSVVDMMELAIAPNYEKYLLSEARPHIAAMGKLVADSIIHGTAATGFSGLAERYGSTTGERGKQVVNFGGTGANLQSVYIVKWDVTECAGIYPKNSKAGLEQISTPNTLIADKDGKQFRAHVTDYYWNAGLKLRDHRHAARLCNIDVTTLRTDANAQQKLFDDLIITKNMIHHVTRGRVVMYVSPELYSLMEVAAFKKSNLALGYSDVEGSTRILKFSGIPIRNNDCQADPEKAVA